MTAPVTLDVWNHFALTWDGATKRLVLNGTEIKRGAASSVFDDDAMLIGADREDGVLSEGFVGQLDELRIYDRALTDPEISAIYVAR
jgi:hypothetical protein